jgi:hypothetical protein
MLQASHDDAPQLAEAEMFTVADVTGAVAHWVGHGTGVFEHSSDHGDPFSMV